MKQHLEALRASRPGCLVVAFGDVATQIVLRASHEDVYRREHLDRLCERAATCFRMMDAAAKTWRCDPGPNQSVLLSDSAATVFVRQDARASEFLCLVCDPPGAVDTLFADARDTLTLITAEP